MTTRVRAAARAHAAQNASQLCKNTLPEHSRLRRSGTVVAAHPATRLEQGAPLQALCFIQPSRVSGNKIRMARSLLHAPQRLPFHAQLE